MIETVTLETLVKVIATLVISGTTFFTLFQMWSAQ